MLKSKYFIDIVRRNHGVFDFAQLRWASYTNRQSKMLAKLMTGKRKPFYKWGDTTAPKQPTLFEETAPNQPSKIITRRSITLNKMFMRHVTEIMASGPIGYELAQIGLHITQVKVCQQYNGLNIFWTASATDDYDMVEQKLESIKKSLRHQLHQMQVMGNVPHITFVRDRQPSYLDELQETMAKADYGDDFVPTLTKQLNDKDEFDIHAESVRQIDEETGEEIIKKPSSIPPMRQDVFGVDHARILDRIKQSMAKKKQAWDVFDKKMTNKSDNPVPFTLSTSFESIRKDHEREKKSGELLNEFLLQRKQMRKEQKQAEQTVSNSVFYPVSMEYSSNDSNNYDATDDQHLFDDENEMQKFYEDYESIDEEKM